MNGKMMVRIFCIALAVILILGLVIPALNG